jgi:hypothetical protein
LEDIMEDLFDFAHRSVRHSDPDTSYAAAYARLAGKKTDRRMALKSLASAGERGLTDYELAARMSRQQNSAGKRRGELRDLGLCEDSGARRVAPSGSKAIVWRITLLGIIINADLAKDITNG